MFKEWWTQTKNDIKNCYKSFTIWINGSILIGLQFADSLQTALPVVREYIPQSAYTILGFIAAINILLRFKTNKPLSEK